MFCLVVREKSEGLNNSKTQIAVKNGITQINIQFGGLSINPKSQVLLKLKKKPNGVGPNILLIELGSRKTSWIMGKNDPWRVK